MIVNLTPHSVKIVDPLGGPSLEIPSSGKFARVATEEVPVGSVLFAETPITVLKTQYGEVVDLPAPSTGVYYIVSMLTRLALPHRLDLLSPARLVRDTEGRVVECQAFEANG